MLVAVLCDIHHHCFLPAEEEIPGARSGGHGDAQVPVVGHEDQHEEVADHHLDDVQHSLQQMGQAQHLLAGNTKPNESENGIRWEMYIPPKRKMKGQQGGHGVGGKVTQPGQGFLHAAGTWRCGFAHSLLGGHNF